MAQDALFVPMATCCRERAYEHNQGHSHAMSLRHPQVCLFKLRASRIKIRSINCNQMCKSYLAVRRTIAHGAVGSLPPSGDSSKHRLPHSQTSNWRLTIALPR